MKCVFSLKKVEDGVPRLRVSLHAWLTRATLGLCILWMGHCIVNIHQTGRSSVTASGRSCLVMVCPMHALQRCFKSFVKIHISQNLVLSCFVVLDDYLLLTQ